MNAIQFIQQHGLTQAKECLSNCACPEDKWFIHEGDLVSDSDFDDLKRLVESVERINFIGGIAEAKTWVEKTKFGLERGHYPSYSTSAIKEKIKRNEQAIADYEQLFGNAETLELETLRDCDTSPNCKKFDERVK